MRSARWPSGLPTVIMSIGHRIGYHLRAVVRQNAGVSLLCQRGVSVAALKLENGGDGYMSPCCLVLVD